MGGVSFYLLDLSWSFLSRVEFCPSFVFVCLLNTTSVPVHTPCILSSSLGCIGGFWVFCSRFSVCWIHIDHDNTQKVIGNQNLCLDLCLVMVCAVVGYGK